MALRTDGESAKVLLDWQASSDLTNTVKDAIEKTSSSRVTDRYCRTIGHDIYAGDIVIVSDAPESPEHYRALVPAKLGIVHATIEVHCCLDH